MVKFTLIIVLLGGCIVRSQHHGSFLGSINRPLCAIQGNYCIENGDCCGKSCNTTSQRCLAGVPTTTGNPILVSDPLSNRVGEDPSACQRVGDNCQQGRDCCSGECLISSRKCVKGQREEPEPQSVDDGRVCSRENQQCSTQPCCTFLTCEKNVCHDKSVFVEGTETVGSKPSQNNWLINRFGEGESSVNTTEVPIATTTGKCAEIGSKCYKESECCRGLRCHGFLHQCVS